MKPHLLPILVNNQYQPDLEEHVCLSTSHLLYLGIILELCHSQSALNNATSHLQLYPSINQRERHDALVPTRLHVLAHPSITATGTASR
jgi:hypothetical protein